MCQNRCKAPSLQGGTTGEPNKIKMIRGKTLKHVLHSADFLNVLGMLGGSRGCSESLPGPSTQESL